jgi:hypothetical protein
MGQWPLRSSPHARAPPSALVLASFPPGHQVAREGIFSNVRCGQSGESSACLFERVCFGPGRRFQFYSPSHQDCETEATWAYYVKSWSYMAWHGYARNFSEHHEVRPPRGEL